MTATYHGTPCKKCGGTERYYMMRKFIAKRPGACVACARERARGQMLTYERNRRKANPEVKHWIPKQALTLPDPFLGAAFPMPREKLMGRRS